MKTNTEAALYIVSTPIGNLEDITLRALRVLSEADVIACEDTRYSGIMLKKLGIEHKRLISYHEHNELQKTSEIIGLVKEGMTVALISDAGTPSVSDPGYKLVHAAVEANIRVAPVPGASAILAALVGSGFAVHRFTFCGFPPQKKGRQTFLKEIAEIDNTVILYESCYRIEKLVEELFAIMGNTRDICIARELTKIHEEFMTGSIEEIQNIIKSRNGLKGEIVVILDGIKKRK